MGLRAYLLDTNIIIHALQGDDVVLAKLAGHDGEVMISALTLVELQRGLHKDPAFTLKRSRRLALLTESIPILSFDEAAAEAYGRIIAELGWVRARDYDRMLAAHAVRVKAVLVTNNLADFRDIPSLSLESWR